MESMTFVVAAKKFFGLKPEQKIAEFLAEVKALTPKDKAEMKPELEKALGIEITN